jgi:DNA-binding MarR family transcriptional regulator
MVRQSNYIPRADLLAALGDRVQAFQEATDELDEAVAARLGLNRTDLRCLSVLARAGATTAGELAGAAGLTRGAMTTALDRIEARGLARRVWDQPDRRAVRVELTDAARREVELLYAPLAREGLTVLQTYTTAELAAALRYLDDGCRLQRAHAERIRRLAQAPDRAAGRPAGAERRISGRARRPSR